MTDKQTKTSISTYSGQWFDIMEPEKYEYDIEEIAHALSHLCRYTGHTNVFYSVAEHSVLVSRLVPDHLALAGLLHDAGEAYLGDVSSPLKALLPGYKKIEHRVERALLSYFGLEFPLDPRIKEADIRMYWQERQSVADNGVNDRLWHKGNRAARKVGAEGMSPKMAKRMFLSRYKELTEGYRKEQNEESVQEKQDV